jgi:hypothetical protein
LACWIGRHPFVFDVAARISSSPSPQKARGKQRRGTTFGMTSAGERGKIAGWKPALENKRPALQDVNRARQSFMSELPGQNHRDAEGAEAPTPKSAGNPPSGRNASDVFCLAPSLRLRSGPTATPLPSLLRVNRAYGDSAPFIAQGKQGPRRLRSLHRNRSGQGLRGLE